MVLIASLLNAIFVGYPIYIMPPQAFIRHPLRWLKCITKYQGTYTCAPNFAYDLCVKNITPDERALLDLSSLKKAINAAEPVQPTTLNEFTKQFSPYGFREEAFTPAYGLAEATVFVTGKSARLIKYAYLDEAALQKNKVVYPDDMQKTHKLVSCGTANYLGQQIKIVNPDTLEECVDEIGEIWISGEHIVKGYLHKPELSKDTFKAKIDGVDYLRTGDLGFIDNSGDIFITGRIKDLIIINGSNYYPQDIELTAESKNPVIRKNSIAAFSVDVDFKEQLVLVIELNRKMLADFDPEKLGSEINAAVLSLNQLTIYEIVFITAGTLPKTTSGKIQRQGCKKQYLEETLKVVAKWQSSNVVKEFPADATVSNAASSTEWIDKAEIMDCISAFLAKNKKIPLESILPASKIADFSIDSIQMAGLSVELEKIIKLPIPEKIFYECITVQDMADYIVGMPEMKRLELSNQKPPNLKPILSSDRKIAIPKFTDRFHKKIS
jgi:acyl-CoA synthetase (AMP-forming)/AMP-acid ligase II/acyl carrier protein